MFNNDKAGNRCDGICRIQRLFLPDGRIVVIRTEIPGNPGDSITNSVGEIAFQVRARFNIDPAKLVWIGHYAAPHISADEWDTVSFRSRPPRSMFRRPAWKQMTQEDRPALVLQPLPETTVGPGGFPERVKFSPVATAESGGRTV